MDTDDIWLRELIDQSPGSPVTGQDIERFRLYICLAPERQVADMIEIIRSGDHGGRRRWRNLDSADPDLLPQNDGIRPGLWEQIVPTRPTRPATAAGVLELVRRGPQVFSQLPVSYQLDALRAVVIRRNSEREEAARLGVNAVPQNLQQRSQQPNKEDEEEEEEEEMEPRLQTWVAEQITELGFSSVGVQEFVDIVLDPDDDDRSHSFHELLVDQNFKIAELRQMIHMLSSKLQILMLKLQSRVDDLPKDAEAEKAEADHRLQDAKATLKNEKDIDSLSENAYHEIIPAYLIAIAHLEEFVVEIGDVEKLRTEELGEGLAEENIKGDM